MSTFDSPLGRCEAVRELVVTDGTAAQCAREHGCPDAGACALAGWFLGRDCSPQSPPRALPRSDVRHPPSSAPWQP